MTRTCYGVGPYGEDKYPPIIGPSRSFMKSGYIIVYQDVRGRFGSEGAWEEMTPHIDHPSGKQHDESTDTSDTVDWLLKNVPNNNGKVGILGISYPGFYTSASIIDSHPAIKAASPQAPVTNLFNNDDAYHNGALMFEANDFYLSFRPQGNPTPETRGGPRPERPNPPYVSKDAYVAFQALEPLSKARAFINNPYFDETLDHPTDDAHWQERDISRHLHNIHAAVLTVGGLFDAEDLSGPWKTFDAIAAQSPSTPNQIVVGPWFHGGWARADGNHIGEARFGSDTSDYFREHIQLPFFEHYLKDGPDPKLAKATVFETGSNQWRSYTAWPPPAATKRMLYLQPGGKLSFDPPAQAGAPRPVSGTWVDAANPDFDQYISDPAHPVPEVGYAAAPGSEREYMAADQRFASKRRDVLVYQTDPLTAPSPSPAPSLPSSTSPPPAPTPTSSSSSSTTTPTPSRSPSPPPTFPAGATSTFHQPFSPATSNSSAVSPCAANFVIASASPSPSPRTNPRPSTSRWLRSTTPSGHRIMVQIQSTWFPLVDLNLQTFVDIPGATAADFKPATERIFHSAQLSSGIEIYFLPPPGSSAPSTGKGN